MHHNVCIPPDLSAKARAWCENPGRCESHLWSFSTSTCLGIKISLSACQLQFPFPFNATSVVKMHVHPIPLTHLNQWLYGHRRYKPNGSHDTITKARYMRTMTVTGRSVSNTTAVRTISTKTVSTPAPIIKPRSSSCRIFVPKAVSSDDFQRDWSFNCLQQQKKESKDDTHFFD